MLLEYLETLTGILKIFIYKILNFNKIYFKNLPKVSQSVKFNIKKDSIVEINKNCRIRRNVSFYCYDKAKIYIGDNVFINENCIISARKQVKIGDNCILGNNISIYDNNHDFKNNITKYVCDEVIIGDNTWIGCNVIILKGVKIGKNCVIGAGSLITKNIPDNSIVYNEKKCIIKSKK